MSLDGTVGDISDIGILLKVDVFREVQLGCDSLMTSLRQAADKTCDKFELYLLNNVLRIPDDLHVPGLDEDENDMMILRGEQDDETTASNDGGGEESSSSLSSMVRYTMEDERAVDEERASLRDRIIKLRRTNARLARTSTLKDANAKCISSSSSSSFPSSSSFFFFLTCSCEKFFNTFFSTFKINLIMIQRNREIDRE